MHPELFRIGRIVVQSYTVLLDVAVVAGLAALAWRGHRTQQRSHAWIDTGLAALLAGIVGGRIEHGIIHWTYFAEHPIELLQVWNGGLGWHMAIILGMIGLLVTCRLLKIDWRTAFDTLTIPLALGAGLTHAGCLLSRCAYGEEVQSLADYPSYLVAELPDMYNVILPRFSTQLYGIALGVVLLIVAVVLSRVIRRPGVMIWPILALLGVGMFGIGFYRGDSVPMAGQFRLDQVFDLAVAALGIILTAITAWKRKRIAKTTPIEPR
ncbi:MAG: prolipoprotein diacylglyceryl transferase [Anaerolineae bacterium]|nr:prolipoprotein diacylglyceryl transferase [Anaerolineae bacterium]